MRLTLFDAQPFAYMVKVLGGDMRIIKLNKLSVYEVKGFVNKVKDLLTDEKDLTFDFTEIERIDTAGIQAVIATVKELGKRGGNIQVLASQCFNDSLNCIGVNSFTNLTAQVKR